MTGALSSDAPTPGSRVAIRAVRESDLPALEWDGEFWALRDHFQQTYEAQLRGRCLMLMADHGGEPIGRLFVQFNANNPLYADGSTRAYLYSLCVRQGRRSQGIGTRLLGTAESLLGERGFHWATIAVAHNNAGALRLYRRRGYRRIREAPSQWVYTDPTGVRHEVVEMCWVLQKTLPESKDGHPAAEAG